MNDFTALLDELASLQAGTEDMAKAMKTDDAEDDKKIAAAADTDGDGKAEGAGEGDGEGGGKDGDDSEYFGKSMSITLPDGTKAEAYDGTEAIHGLHARIDALEAQLAGAADRALYDQPPPVGWAPVVRDPPHDRVQIALAVAQGAPQVQRLGRHAEQWIVGIH